MLDYPPGPMCLAPTVVLEDACLRLGQRRVPLYSGALHYFRHPRATWRAQLEGLRDLGFEMVETYVPWGVHERAAGDWDFGEHESRNDLGHFLDLAHELGLLVFVRPGPHINAELTYFGVPERVIHDPDCQARSPAGNPVPLIAPPQTFPVPSIASEAFTEAAGQWLRAVGEVVAPRVWPRGGVVLLQVDNESSFYFRDGPYDQDHHPDALQDYREFLRARHGTLAGLAAAHGGEPARRWDQVLPPTRFEAEADSPAELGRYLDWAEFRGQMLLGAIDKHAAHLREAGLGELPTVHNVPMGDAGLPYSLGEMDGHVSITGLDYYEGPTQLSRIKRRTLRLAGSVRLPYAPELGLGAPPWFIPRTGRQALQTALCALAYGLRGFNVYMAVNRDRWWGGLLHANGEPTAQAPQCKQLLEALKRLHFHRLAMPVEIGLQVPAEYARLSRATHTLGAASPSVLALATGNPTAACRDTRFGFKHAIQREWWPWLQRTADALDRAGLPYVFVDSASPVPAGLRLLFAPTYGMADAGRLAGLRAFEAGGGVLVAGPEEAVVGADLRPLEPAEPAEPAGPAGERSSGADPAALDDLVVRLQAQLGLRVPVVVGPAPVEGVLHELDGEARVLFLMNPGDEPADAELSRPERVELVDVLTTERFQTGQGRTLAMPARSCRMFEISPAPEVQQP